MRRDESRYRGKGSMRAELDREGLPRKRSASFQLEVILAPWHRDAGWRSRGCIREYDRVVSTETRCKLRFAFGTMFEPGSIQLACVSTCRETSHLQPAVFTKRSNLSSSLRSLSLSPFPLSVIEQSTDVDRKLLWVIVLRLSGGRIYSPDRAITCWLLLWNTRFYFETTYLWMVYQYVPTWIDNAV